MQLRGLMQWRKSFGKGLSLDARHEQTHQITFGELREQGCRGVLVYCADYRCSHSVAMSADAWPDDLRLSDIEDQFTCTACGKRGADVRPDFNWNKQPVRQH